MYEDQLNFRSMITIVFLKHLKRHLKAANLVGCVEIEWDSRTESIVKVYSSVRTRLAKFQLFSTFLYSALQLCLTAFSPYPTGSKLRAMSFTGIYVTAFFLVWRTEGVSKQMINAFVKFENLLLQGERYLNFVQLVLPEFARFQRYQA